MSKILDTLRRRDPPHGTPSEAVRQELERRGLREQSGPPHADDALDPWPADTPFIEVGAGIESTIEAPQPASPASPASRPRQTGEESAGGQWPLGAIAFRAMTQASSSTNSTVNAGLAIWRSPTSALADRYRRAAESLAATIQALLVRSLALTAIDDLPHQACVGVNLAIALADHCRRTVLLIDADGRNRRIARLLDRPPAPGWTDLLAGLAPDQAIQETDWPRLHLVAGGNRLAAAHPAIHGDRARSLIHDLSHRYDMVLVFTPAWTDLTGPSALLHRCGGVCLVADHDHASESADLPRQKLLEEQGICVVGKLVFRG